MRYLFYLTILLSLNVFAQRDDSTTQDPKWYDKFDLQGYGIVNYYAYDWDLLPDKRDAIDPERLNLYLYYNFSPKIQFKSEIEFEHGGTGSTMSFDPLEEFGEFENEIDKGGAVILEQLNVLFKLHKKFKVRVGKMRFYMGNASKQDRPRQYFTPYRSEIENTIIPLGWYETGIELSGDFNLNSQKQYPLLSYKAYVVSGLDNTGFSSYNWIRNGYQKRFELINANSLAYALRLDYIFGEGSEIGLATYFNDATPNRPKNDFDVNSMVTYTDIHFTLEHPNYRIRALAMYSSVQNSEALSTANRNLSNNLNVKRTPVAKAAAGAYAEFAYDITTIWNRKKIKPLFIFLRGEWYDSMFETEGNVTDNPRYDRQVLHFGLNYFPLPNIVLKTSYALRKLGSGEKENTFSLGLGFDF